jgi:hypothetical protein
VSYLEKWHNLDNSPFHHFSQLDTNKLSAFLDLICIADTIKILFDGNELYNEYSHLKTAQEHIEKICQLTKSR